MFAIDWLIYIPAAALLSAAPGPSNLLSMTHGMQVGLTRTAFSQIGRLAAFAVLIILVAVGLGAVLETSEIAFSLVKWGGVAYLAYIGWKLIRSKDVDLGESGAGLSAVAMMKREFFVALTNPKAMLIFSAFLPQFVVAKGNYTSELLMLGAVFLVIEFAVACAYALSGTLVRRIDFGQRGGVMVNRISGGMMLGAAVFLSTVRRG